jgi:hypothetical protein
VTRSWSFTAVIVFVALTAVGCGGGSSKSKASAASPSTTAAPAATSATTAVVAATGKTITTPVCGLATPSQVQTLLGGPAHGAGTERVFEPTYKTCNWTTDASAGNVNALTVGVVIKTKPTDKGFAGPTDISPTPVSGVGDSANYYSKLDSSGSGRITLVANKGPTSLSISLTYASSTPHPGATQAAVGQLGRDIFTQLGA